MREPVQGGEGRLRVVDFLRFVAAMAVVGFHFTGRDSIAWAESVRDVFPFLSRFTIYGGFGPYLFFMISGFVILMSTWGRPVHSFIASRVARIFPAYWIAVAITAVVLYTMSDVLYGWQDIGLAGAAANLTMFQSAFGIPNLDGAYWTLWVELKFYLLLAVMALIGITRERMLLLCLGWPVLGAMAAQSGSGLLAELLMPTYAPFFCIGILLYLVYREGWSGTIGLLLGLNYCFALWVAAEHYIAWSVRVAGAPVSFRALAVLLTLCIAALAVATLTPVARLDWRWLTFVGALTYPLYLIHQVAGWVLLNQLGPVLPAYVALAVVVALMLVAAYLVHRCLERPFAGRLRRAIERDLAPLAARLPRTLPTHTGTARAPAVPAPLPHPSHPADRRPDPAAGWAPSADRTDTLLATGPAGGARR